MLLSVTHETRYHYSAPVWLEPHTLHLFPGSSPFQAIHQYHLHIEPLPILTTEMVDIEGNQAHLVCFSGPTDYFLIRSTFYAECRLTNPFSYLLYPFEATKIPFIYPEAQRPVLQPYLQLISGNPAVREYARQLIQEAQQETLGFLQLVTKRIFADFTYEYRETGSAQAPEETLSLKKGACRDFSMLMVEICRLYGVAARFVSGYLQGNPHKEQYLHAWVELYLPGGGWRGYDPTQGEIVADRHVILAASANPANVSPVKGIYRGTASAKLETMVTVSQATMMSQSQQLFQ